MSSDVERLPVELLLHPATGAAGVARCYVLVNDLTQRRMLERHLHDARESYRSLREAIDDYTWMVDADCRYLLVSGKVAARIGIPKELILGSSYDDFHGPEDSAKFRANVREALASQTPLQYEHQSGHGGYYSLRTLSPVWLGDEGINSADIVVSKDITGRKLVEEGLNLSLDRAKRTLEGTVNALSATAERRDPYTAGHQQRVSQLGAAIARHMGLSAERVETVRNAGKLHDIGKTHIPAEILAKPGSLNDVEMSMIRTHSEIGYNIVKEVEFPGPVAEIVLQHHERMDGSGYPNGLSGDHVLLEARIIGLADVVEAIWSNRPYRPALGTEAALNEIVSHEGSLYDPAVVGACLQVCSRKPMETLLG